MMTKRKGSVFAYLTIIIVLAAAAVFIMNYNHIYPPTTEGNQLKKFSSCSAISNFVKAGSEEGYGYYGAASFGAGTRAVSLETQTIGAPIAGAEKTSATEISAEDYSATNIQVAGVDEPDIVKNDGKYIYTLSGNTIFIVDAYPAENAQIVSQINFTNETVSEIFVNGNKLVVFSNHYEYTPVYYDVAEEKMIAPPRYSTEKTFVYVYDISDKSNPKLARNLSVDGNYYDARMIGDYVYVVVDNLIQYNDNITIPTITAKGVEKPACGCVDVYYFDIPDYSYKFTTILSINTQNDNQEPNSKVFLMGYTQNMFVSQDNIYITYMKRISQKDMMTKVFDAIIPALPSGIGSQISAIWNSDMSMNEKTMKISEAFNNYMNNLTKEEREAFMKTMQEKMIQLQSDMIKEMERTIIHKISIKNGEINYIAQGDAPGNVLNQFSMDEYNGYFRIATTTSQWQGTSANHLYVLDENLNIVGKLEDLAKGEKIYSARFLGNRAYMVTFKKIDPLFVIDLSNPTNPSVLGYLKVTGYSDYLHPYDENHIIGIGKETNSDENSSFAYQQGVKISLFDVSDVANPIEISKIEIGDRGTDSEALRDHKAFLFDKSRNLLVMPISLAEVDESQYKGEVPDWAYGTTVWQGAYVFSISLEDGIKIRGRITHDENVTKSGDYYSFDYNRQIRRSLHMDDVLYTISSGMVKANKLGTLEEIKSIELMPLGETIPYYPKSMI
jgi:uncharacterized secreted protein with C-terminal beta-propeller domain